MSYKGFASHSKVSKEEQEFYDLKNKAAEYYRSNGVPEKIESVLNEMFWQKPDDIYGYLANYFSRLSHTPVISKITGREVFDGRGSTAVQTEVHCIIRNEETMVCSAVMPGGPCDGLADGMADSQEVVSNSSQQCLSNTTALKWIREHLSPMLQGCNPTDQNHIDKILRDFFMARYLEHKDNLNREKEEALSNEKLSEDPPQATPAPVAPAKDKKGGDKGKKGNSTEKLLPLSEPPEPRLPGATAVGVVSLVVAKTAASLLGAPLYRHITSLRVLQAQNEMHLPLPMITILSCGKNSVGKLNLLEEVILMPSVSQSVREVISMGLELQCEMRRVLNGSAYKAGPTGVSDEGALQVGFEHPEQALDLVTEVCANLALPLGSDLRLVINCAAHGLMDYSRGKYEVMSGCHKSPDELVDMYKGLINKYPAIKSLIDPFRKEDVDQWERLASVIGQSCCLIADAASNLCPPWSDAKPLPPGVTGVINRHHNDMTISDLIQSIAEQKDAETILAAGCGDTSIVDLAVGSGVSFLKLGGLRGGERMDKYNRLMAIKEELEQEGILGATEKKQPLSVLSETFSSGSSCNSVTISAK